MRLCCLTAQAVAQPPLGQQVTRFAHFIQSWCPGSNPLKKTKRILPSNSTRSQYRASHEGRSDRVQLMRTEMNAYEHNPTMWRWAKMIGRDVLSALVGVAIGSLVTLRMEIWHFVRQQPFQWTISGSAEVTVAALFVALCAWAIFGKKTPELTPSNTRIIQANGRCLLRIGVENTGKGKAFDTRIAVLVWRCSQKCTPFVVPISNGNPISTRVSEQIEVCLPKEPIFIAISFSHRSRPKSRRNEQRPSFYYKWNGIDSALVH